MHALAGAASAPQCLVPGFGGPHRMLDQEREHALGTGRARSPRVLPLGRPRLRSTATRCELGISREAARSTRLGRRPDSDRGSRFLSGLDTRTLEPAGLVGSMGRVASSADNAVMESWFSLLQKSVLDRQRWATRRQLRLAIVTWIEGTYHHRRQRRLGPLTPSEFGTIYTTAPTGLTQHNTMTVNQSLGRPLC